MTNISTRQRGAVAVEFALILPVLVVLLFAIIELGLGFQRFEAINAAAREGARVASLPTTSTVDACNRVTASLSGTSFTGTPTCTATNECQNSEPSVTVTVTVPNQISIPFLPAANVTITGSGDFRCE